MRIFNFKQYFSLLKTNRLFKNTVILFTSIACVLFLCFSAVAVTVMSHAAIERLQDSELKMLEQSENTTDMVLRNINYCLTDAFENDNAIQLALSKPYSPKISIDASNSISKLRNNFDLFDNMYLFNSKYNVIYIKDHPVYTFESFPDKNLIEYIKSAPQYTVNKPFTLMYENGEISEYQKEANLDILKKNVLMTVYKSDAQSAMVVFIDCEEFDKLVNASAISNKQTTTIYNSDGTVISSSDKALFGKDLSDNKVYKTLISKNSISGISRIGKNVYFYRKGNMLDMLYVSAIPNSAIVGSFLTQFIVMLIFGLLLILILLLSSIKLSMSIYRPFKKLRDDISEIVDIDTPDYETGSDEDLAKISKNLVNIRSEYNAMQRTEQLYTISKRNELVYSILTGVYDFNPDDMTAYNIIFPHPYTSVLLLRLDNTDKIKQSDIGLIQYGTGNVAQEIFDTNNMRSYYTSFGGEYDIIFIVNHTSPELNKECLLDIKKYIYNIFSVTVTVAYDSAPHDIDVISDLYRNCEYAMQYRLVRGRNSIISYSSLNNALCDVAYPDNIEKELIKQINLKDESKIEENVDAFIEYIRPLAYMRIIVYSCILIMALDTHSDTNDDDTSPDLLSDTLTRVETIEDTKAMILVKCREIMAAVNDYSSETKYTRIANMIEEYIDNNYTDSNLSIHLIAAHVNKSVNYARNIFKQSKGISISDYITKKRFNEVCRLLVDTNLNAHNIAAKTGMNPGSYFYTAFKKYTGLTPEQFRNKYAGTGLSYQDDIK